MSWFDSEKGPILVTGAAGFIGANACRDLLEKGCHVVGVDNLNDYYDVALKQHRLELLNRHPHFQFKTLELTDRSAVAALFEDAVRAGNSFGSSGRRALFIAKSQCLHRVMCWGFRIFGELSSNQAGALGFRLFQLGIRQQ